MFVPAAVLTKTSESHQFHTNHESRFRPKNYLLLSSADVRMYAHMNELALYCDCDEFRKVLLLETH